MKKIYLIVSVLSCLVTNAQSPKAISFSLTKQQLKDKIKGGWAGQTIGVTFGGPYEFRFQGTFIGDYQSLKWYDGYLKDVMINNPGLYDDLYMDLTFVDVFEKYGLDAPLDSRRYRQRCSGIGGHGKPRTGATASEGVRPGSSLLRTVSGLGRRRPDG